MRCVITLTSAAVLTLLSGCATPVPPLYNWGPYESQVNAHFKGESPESQILVLEKHASETKAKGLLLPPGYMAHLGLLYGKVGRDDDFANALKLEKEQFPESATYIDKLLTQATKGAPHVAK